MTTILLTYSGRDANNRSLLVAATRAAGIPVRFVEVPGVLTDPVSRRGLCAARLQRCDAAIVLIGQETGFDAGVACDLDAATDAGVPVHAICIDKSGRRCGHLRDYHFSSEVDWVWPRIAALLQRTQPKPGADLAS